jgi:hypothetical protein
LILNDESDEPQLAPLLEHTEIMAGHIWRVGFVRPKVTTTAIGSGGARLLDTGTVRKGLAVSNVL